MFEFALGVVICLLLVVVIFLVKITVELERNRQLLAVLAHMEHPAGKVL